MTPGGGGGVLYKLLGGYTVCAAGTLKPLGYTRPHSDAFCYPILD